MAGIIAYSISLSTFTTLAVSLTTQRESGQLKRLRGTPMPAWTFIAAQIAARDRAGAGDDGAAGRDRRARLRGRFPGSSFLGFLVYVDPRHRNALHRSASPSPPSPPRPMPPRRSPPSASSSSPSSPASGSRSTSSPTGSKRSAASSPSSTCSVGLQSTLSPEASGSRPRRRQRRRPRPLGLGRHLGRYPPLPLGTSGGDRLIHTRASIHCVN